MRAKLQVTASTVSLLVVATLVGSATTRASTPTTEVDDWESVVAAAEDEGEVVLYISAPDVAERMEPVFEERYDIDLQFERAAAGDLIARIQEERDADVAGADVAVLAEPSWYTDNAAELLALQGPAWEQWTDPAFVSDTWFVPLVNPYVIAYNTDLVEVPITGYEDALSAGESTQIGSIDTVSAAVSGWYSWLEEQFGEEYLTGLAGQDPLFYPSVVPMAQALGAGEIGIQLFAVPTVINGLKAEGAPVDYVLPEPALGTAYGAAALGWGEHPNAAAVLMDFMATEEGQLAIHGSDGVSASPLGVEGALDPSTIEVWDSQEWPSERVDEYVARWQSIFGRN
jgi:iron(III) transport system substrate-binding protein